MNWVYDKQERCFIFKNGGIISARKGWEVVAKSTNRYNQDNDHYLDEIEELARANKFNNYLIAAMIANAIHENLGSPLVTPSSGRVGLWQNDKRLAKYMGNTVESNIRAFKQDYDYGKWYDTYDKNGWNPTYYKIFRDADNVDDATFGMAAGYERFNGSNNRNNTEVKSRQKTARLIYDLITLNETTNEPITNVNNTITSKKDLPKILESLMLFSLSSWGNK